MAKTKAKPAKGKKAKLPKPAKAAKPAPVTPGRAHAPTPAATTPFAATSGPETWADAPLSLIRPCPFNVRRTFDPEDIAGLGESIRADRLKEPLLVRPVGEKAVPTFDGKKWQGLAYYELADGERRLRALQWIADTYPDEAEAANRVPVIVRPMTDEQVRAVMLLSREQSRDLVVSELVRGYSELRAGLPDDNAVAALVGKSPGYVRSVLRLAKLPAWALAAVDAGALPRATAELVARVPGEESRKKAAACVLLGLLDPSMLPLDSGDDGRDTWEAACKKQTEIDGEICLSYRDTKDLIRNHFTVELKGAAFSRKELYTLPGCEEGHERHIPSCDECPKRAGNDPEATAEGVRADVCLDPDCYRTKVEAYREKEVAKHAAKGIELAEVELHAGSRPPRGWCFLSDPLAHCELNHSPGAVPKKYEDETLRKLLSAPGAADVPEFLAFTAAGKPAILAKTADVRKALVGIGVLPRPEPRPRREEKPAATPSANGRPAAKQGGPSSHEIDAKAAEIAAGILREYTQEQCSALDEHEDADHDDGPIRVALELAARALCYELIGSGGSGATDALLEARFGATYKNRDETLDKAVSGLKPSELIGLLVELGAACELHYGNPEHPTGASLLEFAELDWPALREQAKRVLTGGESAEEKVAKADEKTDEAPVALPSEIEAEKRRVTAICAKNHRESIANSPILDEALPPPPKKEAGTPLATVPNFPPEALEQLVRHGVTTVEEVHAEVAKIKREPGRANATVYTAMRDLNVPGGVYLDAADAITDWEKAKVAVKEETTNGKPAKAKKAKVTT